MKKQHDEPGNEKEQLLQYQHLCEKKIADCSIDQFSNWRYQLKQVKEKLRLLNQLNRIR